MSDSVDRVFAHALQTVRKIPKTGSARPPAADRLRLYGLYKQSMEGDVHGVMERPHGFGEDARAESEKWDAWNAQSGLPKTEAKRQYIATLIETMHKYASATPEARELVAELEFVWDQIRSNQSLSPASSPHRGGVRNQQALLPSAYSDQLGVVSPNPYGEEEFEDDVSGIDTDHQSDRKWRRRVEQALAKMATEVTALREQLEDERTQKRRGRLRHWLVWVVWLTGRHLIVEIVFWGVVFLWMRKKGDMKAQDALRLVVKFVKDGLREIKFWGKKNGR